MLSNSEIIQYVHSLKDLIQQKYKKFGHTPEVDSLLVNEIKAFLLKSEQEEYDQKTIQFDAHVRAKYSEIDDLHTAGNQEIESLKNTYYEKISDELEGLADSLEIEKQNIIDGSTQIQGISTGIKSIEASINQNNKSFDFLINNLNEINAEFRNAVSVSIKQIQENIQPKTELFTSELEENKNKAILELEESIKNENLKIIQEGEQKIDSIRNAIINDDFKSKFEAIEKRLNDGIKSLLEVDLDNLIKYLFFVIVTACIIWLDYEISQDLVMKVMEEEYTDATETYKYVIEFIIPLFFSGGLLFIEFFSKYVKSFWNYALHLLTVVLSLIMVLTPIYNWLILDGGAPTTLDIVMRIIMFLGIIFVWGYILRRYVVEHEFVSFIKDTVLYPVRLFLILPLNYIHYFFEINLLSFKKRVLLKDVDILRDKIDDIMIKPKNVSIDFADYGGFNTENIEKKYGSIGVLNGYIKNIDDMVFKMQTIENTLNHLEMLFGKNSQLIGNRIVGLREKLVEYSTIFNEEKVKINTQTEIAVSAKKEYIQKIVNNRTIKREQFDNYESLISKGILDGLITLNKSI